MTSVRNEMVKGTCKASFSSTLFADSRTNYNYGHVQITPCLQSKERSHLLRFLSQLPPPYPHAASVNIHYQCFGSVVVPFNCSTGRKARN